MCFGKTTVVRILPVFPKHDCLQKKHAHDYSWSVGKKARPLNTTSMIKHVAYMVLLLCCEVNPGQPTTFQLMPGIIKLVWERTCKNCFSNLVVSLFRSVFYCLPTRLDICIEGFSGLACQPAWITLILETVLHKNGLAPYRCGFGA